MAKIVLTINANNKATQSVKLLNAEVQTLSKTLSSIKVNKNLTAQINALTKHYTAVADAHAKITANANKQAIADEKLKQQQSKTALAIAKENTGLERQNKIKAQTESITNRTARAKEKDAQSIKLTISQTQKLVKQYADLLNQINAIEKSYKKGTFDKLKNDVSSYFNDVKGLDDSLKSGAITQEDYNSRIIQATASLQGFKTEMATTRAESKNLHGTLKDIVSGFFNFQLGAMLVMKPLQLLRSALSSINETLVKTEDSVIALQRVLPSGSASDSEISSKLYHIAQDYGQTFDNVSQIAQNFARTGMSWADTIKATEAAVLALNVAELDAEEATNGLIAILSQFGLEASDLETVIDKLNKTADNFPVTTEKILAALQRTGSAADNANLSLDQTIALITALSKATGRSGENIGTALNSLIQYSSKSSALDTFAKLSEESAKVVAQYRQSGATILDVWRQVSKEIKNLKSEQADLLDDYFATEDGNALKEALDGELQDIYTELGGVYDTANTFRKNYFIALLGNMDTVEQAMGTLQGAAGYSQDENQKYLDTYTAKLNTLQAKWQDIANDEQGLLGIKKDLLDIGSGVLDIIKYAGGLKTVLIALGVIVSTIVLSFKGEAIIATLTKIGTLLKSMTIDAIPNAIGAWKSFAKGISSAGMALQASLPLITAVIIALSALDSAIRRGIEEREERERKAIEQQNEAIKKSNESIDAQKKEVAQMNGVADSVENLRKILDDSSQSEEEKSKAQEKLLQIQNSLVESNNKYKDSLDLTNGNLKEQLGLIEQLTTEQLKQNAQDFLQTNKSQIEIANSRLSSTSNSNTDYFLTGVAADRYKFRDLINEAIEKSGALGAHIITDNTYGFAHGWGKDIKNSWEEDGLWGAVGSILVDGFTNVFSEEGWTGEAKAGLSFSGTIEQQIDAISKLQEYVAQHRDELGLSAEEHTAFNNELSKQLTMLNSEEYKQAQLLAQRAKATQDWLDGTIDEAEYLKIVYGIEKDITAESDEQTNNIKDTKDFYDDLIKKLEELRDIDKERLDLEEKRKAILEAEEALRNAENSLTERIYDAESGTFTRVRNETAINEARENLEKAQRDYEQQAYNTIIEQLKDETATNESILNVIKSVADYLPEFGNAIKQAVKETTGVDLNLPIHDSGGILTGLGGIKATARDEIVLPPDITKKILEPTSNAQFMNFAKALGVMFEPQHNIARALPNSYVSNYGGNTTNNNHSNNNYTVNGLPVSREMAENHTIAELFEAMRLSDD